ncbi:MAG: hypothetical protein WBN00_19490 [Sedimenticolaceae bacterium]
MKRWTMILAGLGMLSVMQLAHTESAGKADENRGRYEGVTASANSVWVVDTHTGAVRKCTQEFSDQTPACSGYSK